MAYELNATFDIAAQDDSANVIVLAAANNNQVHGMAVDPRGAEIIKAQAKKG